MHLITIILLIVIILQLQFITYKMLRSKTRHGSMKGAVLLDTSALMDGRILTAAQTGFIPNRLVIPKSVVAELQLLADQADTEKRTRARHGLDVISALRALDSLEVRVFNDDGLDGGVDERLVTLALRHNASLCTIDFNLNKVAKANEITVLNLNELAQSIRMAFLPGETISITLQQKGQDSHQGVGYLADGTMVVVEKAATKIGQNVEIEFIRSLQTAAGRMMFAKLAGTSNGTNHDYSNSTPKKASKRPSGRNIKSATQPPKKRTSRSKEDSLIELVNSQDA